MPDLLPQERLQPSLLDRLTDDQPGVKVESRDQRVLSIAKLREGVLRDLAWLMNTVQASAGGGRLAGHEHARRSVLNYGVPDLAGTHIAGRDIRRLEAELTEAVRTFEPRILADTLSVKVEVADGRVDRRAVTFVIRGDLWAQPVPLSLFLKTELDLETGAVTVAEQRR